jgi:RHS repeat-associated protein
MQMPGRKFSSASGYRYGFNGKENDKEAGEGIQDYGMRIYDGRLGRFLSVDPLAVNYPDLTPYQFASNRPLDGVDLDGKEWFAVYKFLQELCNPQARNSNDRGFVYGFLRTTDATGIADQIVEQIKHAISAPPPTASQTLKQSVEMVVGGPAWMMAKGLFQQAKSGIVDGNMQQAGEFVGNVSMIAAGGRSPGGKTAAVEEIFTEGLASRTAAEEYALTKDRAYNGGNFENANNTIIKNNPNFDLIDANKGAIVDVTTTISPNMNISGLFKKLNNLVNGKNIALTYDTKVLQVYVPKGLYTKAQISNLKTKLEAYKVDYQLEGVDVRVNEIAPSKAKSSTKAIAPVTFTDKKND